MRRAHFTCVLAALLGLWAGPSRAQQPPAVQTAHGYAVFGYGVPVGREAVTVRTDANGTAVSSQSRISAQNSVIVRFAEFKYRPDWTLESLEFDGDISGSDIVLKTSFKDGVAVTEGTQSGKPVALTHQVSPQGVALMNPVFASYVALARRLQAVPPNGSVRAYVAGQGEIEIKIAGVFDERMQLGTSFLNVRRYEMRAVNPAGELPMQLTSTDTGEMLRFSVPSQGLDVLREDVATSTSRTQVYSNPTDEAVIVPTVGFNIGATLTRPTSGAARLPVVVLVGGASVNDRDGVLAGVPMLGQLAQVLADAGFLAVRFDRRGFGQSGGRSESAGLNEYADDVQAIVRWLSERKDVDPKRIALVGHAEGGWVSLIAGSREKRVAAVVSIAAAGGPGGEVVLEQQQTQLDMLKATPDVRERQVALQKQIHAAVLSGKGWEGVPPDLRQRADTPWFASLLRFDPAKVLDGFDQPLLFMHGQLDHQMPATHVDRLAATAQKVADSKAVEVVVVRGVNHLLVPAVTGEMAEYSTLTDRTVSKDVTGTLTAWLTKTFQGIR
jgi:pimeloyl-ACP methyl ester carboxylesterase